MKAQLINTIETVKDQAMSILSADGKGFKLLQVEICLPKCNSWQCLKHPLTLIMLIIFGLHTIFLYKYFVFVFLYYAKYILKLK